MSWQSVAGWIASEAFKNRKEFQNENFPKLKSIDSPSCIWIETFAVIYWYLFYNSIRSLVFYIHYTFCWCVWEQKKRKLYWLKTSVLSISVWILEKRKLLVWNSQLIENFRFIAHSCFKLIFLEDCNFIKSFWKDSSSGCV